ncbi:hypothetical protein [Streptomyces sp. NPDC058872]|uniref:hypothetical protein n=1 Tax=Streptomyces sp. NPDC058872 TaxID=3346661 RepID=UPI0036983950
MPSLPPHPAALSKRDQKSTGRTGGIDEARIGSTYFEAETPLSDGSGNPPEGWDDPTQLGTMTLKSESEAVFTDDAGHEVRFVARPGASAFKHICA